MRAVHLLLCTVFCTTVACRGGSQTAGTQPLSNTGDTRPDSGFVPPEERTEDMIAASVLAAMAINDVDLASHYLPAIEDVAQICPELWSNPEERSEIENEFANMRSAMAESFDNCRELVNFPVASPLLPEWEHGADVADCSGLAHARTGRIELDGDRGYVEITIQVVTLVDGRMYLGGEPICWVGK